jgi:hypothetical protein
MECKQALLASAGDCFGEGDVVCTVEASLSVVYRGASR